MFDFNRDGEETMFRLHGRALAAFVWVGVGMACGDASTAPSTGTIRVAIRTSGGDPDNDGYWVVLNTGAQRLVLGSGIDFVAIPSGAYSVALGGVAANCSVSGDSSLPVTVAAGEIAAVSFDVVCAATGIDVTIHTTGKDIPRSYHVTLGFDLIALDADSSVLVSRLQPGSYAVTLAPLIDNCSVAGGRQVTVDVALRSVTNVLFDITCAPAIRPEKIAFAFDSTLIFGSESWIGLVSPDGTGRRTLVRGDSPAWSRGGDKVVFSTFECLLDPYYNYYQTCLGGLALIDPEIGNDSTLSQGKSGLGPSWSPTSDVIAFWQSSGDIFLLAPDGSVPAPLPPAGFKGRDPAWAPDGRRLAFTCSSLDATTTQICIFDPSPPFIRITPTGWLGGEPAWSPDASRIAFTAGTMVAVANVSSGGVTLLTHGFSPDWSGDGTKLVFADVGGLYTINADGSNRQLLTSGPLHTPAWRR